MKKLAAIALVVLLAGCGGSSKKSASTSTATATGGGGKQIKVGLVTDINQLNDRGFNHLADMRLRSSDRERGVQARGYQPASAQEYIPNLAQFAQRPPDLGHRLAVAQAGAMPTAA